MIETVLVILTFCANTVDLVPGGGDQKQGFHCCACNKHVWGELPTEARSKKRAAVARAYRLWFSESNPSSMCNKGKIPDRIFKKLRKTAEATKKAREEQAAGEKSKVTSTLPSSMSRQRTTTSPPNASYWNSARFNSLTMWQKR